MVPVWARVCAGGAVVLAGVAALLVSAGVVGGTATAAANTTGAWSFPSESALNPPGIIATPAPKPKTSVAPEYLFLAPIRNITTKGNFVGKPGPEIVEPNGTPVWEDPLGRSVHVGTKAYMEVAMDFHTASYAGQPVLVWWQGHITPNGFGTGTWEIDNDHYQTIASLRAPTVMKRTSTPSKSPRTAWRTSWPARPSMRT